MVRDHAGDQNAVRRLPDATHAVLALRVERGRPVQVHVQDVRGAGQGEAHTARLDGQADPLELARLERVNDLLAARGGRGASDRGPALAAL